MMVSGETERRVLGGGGRPAQGHLLGVCVFVCVEEE